MKTATRQALCWLGMLLLAGCSSGDDGGTAAPPAPPSAPATITVANAPTISGAVIDATLGVQSFGTIFEGAPLPTANARAAIHEQQADVLNIPIGPETTNCASGGTVTVSGDVASLGTFTAGDTLTIVFTNCDEGDGETLNGTFQFTIQTFEGDLVTELFNLVVTTTVNNFRVTEQAETTTVNGDITIGIDTRMSTMVTLTVSGNSLRATGPGFSDSVSNYSLVQEFDEGTLSYTLTTAGTVASLDINGSVSYQTTITFQGSVDSPPSSGELVITGANNATIRLIALDAVNVRLQVDVDGDGAVDQTIDTTWDALEN